MLKIISIGPIDDSRKNDADTSHPFTRIRIRQSTTIDDLIRQQGVKPIADVTSYFGKWKWEWDDGFEEALEEIWRGGNETHDA